MNHLPTNAPFRFLNSNWSTILHPNSMISLDRTHLTIRLYIFYLIVVWSLHHSKKYKIDKCPLWEIYKQNIYLSYIRTSYMYIIFVSSNTCSKKNKDFCNVACAFDSFERLKRLFLSFCFYGFLLFSTKSIDHVP